MQFRIFYIDDEIDLAENFLDQFSSDGITIQIFTNPNEGISAAKTNPPDLFFIDYTFPGTNGDRVAQGLDPKVPKILVSGNISIKTEYKFDKVISKPYNKQDVLSTINVFRSSKVSK